MFVYVNFRVYVLGACSVVLRPENIGLMQQWFNVWQPASESELAFVFEDDVEVSPLYFRWASRAARVYYTPTQVSVHRALLRHVRALLNEGGGGASGSRSSFAEDFLAEYSGEPLLFGICLQKQHLDPTHYPKALRVKNGFRPYLHR